MAGRERIYPALGAGRGPLPVQLAGAQALSQLEHKLVMQHAEIQRVVAENQRLSAAHVALRQDLAAAQQEIPRLQRVAAGVHTEKEQQLRGLAEKAAKLEAELLATQALKSELQKHQEEAKKFVLISHELTKQVQQLSEDLLRAGAEAQQLSVSRVDMEALREEVQRARTAFEYERETNTELMEQGQVMENNLVTLAREVEKLRAELAIAEKRARGAYAGELGSGIGLYKTSSLW